MTPAGGAPGPGPGHGQRGVGFWVTAAVGWAVIGWALWQIIVHRVDTRPAQLARFVLGGVVVHDLILVPLTLTVAALVARVPAAARRWAQAGLVVAGVAALFAYPLVRGFAHGLRNPTSLPRNYTVALLVVVGVTWSALAVTATAQAACARRRARQGPCGS